jgi:hypothetical protein
VKKSWFLFILFLFILAVAQADEKGKKQMFTGTIENIDPSAKKLTVKKEKKADLMEFTWSADLYVWTKGKALQLEDLIVGDEVTVYYDPATSQAEKLFVRTKTNPPQRK